MASHSRRLAAALADIAPVTPKVPYYSATLFDPREQPVCDGAYWVDNLRNTVQFAAAVQAAMEDGYRSSPGCRPPLPTHAVEQTGQPRHVGRRLAGMRRASAAWSARLADGLHRAGAALNLFGAVSRWGGWWMRRAGVDPRPPIHRR